MTNRDFSGVVGALEAFARGGADPDDPKERKRRRILEVATALFLQLGYRKTSIDDIAARAGVAKGTVYLYFKTKSDVLLHAIAEEKLRHVDAMRPVFVSDAPPREKLRMLLRESLLLTSRMPLASRLTAGDPEFAGVLSEMDPVVMRQSEQMQSQLLVDLLVRARGGRKAADADRERALVLRGLLLNAGALISDDARQGMPIDRWAAALADVLVDGFAPTAPATSKSAPKSKRRS